MNSSNDRTTADHISPATGMRFLLIVLLGVLLGTACCTSLRAGTQFQDTLSTVELKNKTLEELMEISITIVTKQPRRLQEAAASVYVISGDDIRRSGKRSVPEVLRLAPNLDVAQVNASQWAISARGFNNVFANKLLVLIDGRSVYTPLYAGVFWDVQDALLEDIDRIEVISGPGGTLWGANAVNGIINIITKPSEETQGGFIEGGGGTELRGFGGVRYGGRLAPSLHYRAYMKAFKNQSTVLVNGADAGDDWHLGQGGVRFDWEEGNSNRVSLHADYYDGRPNPTGVSAAVVHGGNIVGRWNYTISERSDLQLQAYYDRAWRNIGGAGLISDLATYDFDAQHRFQLLQRQELRWGVGVRFIENNNTNLPILGFTPAYRMLRLYTAFVQDEITLIEEHLRLTLGSKLEHNSYTGVEFQPGARIAWMPTRQQTLWGAVSRAVRTPSRADRDLFVHATPTLPVILGSAEFLSEDMLAYELGWRAQASTHLLLSAAIFFNEYDDLRSMEPPPPPAAFPSTLANGVEGETYGIEIGIVQQVTGWWRLRSGYRYMQKDLRLKPWSRDRNRARADDDVEHQGQIHSTIDLPHDVELDAVLRYGDVRVNRFVPANVNLDLRVAWRSSSSIGLELAGQNLFDARHPEFIATEVIPASPSPREIRRSIYGRITLTP